jgi:hypothetical protein
MKGSEAWRYDTICALCRGVVGAEEEVHLFGSHIIHDECLKWLLSLPEDRFKEILEHLPLDTREGLRKAKKGG